MLRTPTSKLPELAPSKTTCPAYFPNTSKLSFPSTMSLQCGSAIASSRPVAYTPKPQLRPSHASTGWKSSSRSLLLCVLSVAILASGTAGQWQGTCSEKDKSTLKAQVQQCGPAVGKNKYPDLPGGSEFKAASVCEPGCTCIVVGTQVMFTSAEDLVTCVSTTVVEVVQGAMYVGPASMCQQSCGQCASPKCRFKCTSVASSSCLSQMGGSASSPPGGSGSPGSSSQTGSSTETSPSTPASGSEDRKKSGGLNAGEIVGIVSGILGAIAAVVTIYVFVRNRKQPQ
jgi:hypothetical protein